MLTRGVSETVCGPNGKLLCSLRHLRQRSTEHPQFNGNLLPTTVFPVERIVQYLSLAYRNCLLYRIFLQVCKAPDSDGVSLVFFRDIGCSVVKK